jgi:flagellar basal-body rod protein FlgB
MLDRIAASKEHYLNLLSARQKLVASNIANADTPGYRTKDIDFQREFLTLTHGAAPNIRSAGPAAGRKRNSLPVCLDVDQG